MYLSFILCMRDIPIEPQARQAAGLTLKGFIEQNFAQIPMESIFYVQLKLREAFYD